MAGDFIAVSVHRFEGGRRRKLGPRRLLHLHEYATVQDEEQFELTTPDGGNAWVVAAGPPGAMRHTDWADIDITTLSPAIAAVLHAYVEEASLVTAVWTWAQNSVYEWDPGTINYLQHAEREGIDVSVRSIPNAVLITPATLSEQLPADWPYPILCVTADDLFEELARLAT